jgi:YaiO family outer membrane protein
LNYANRFKTNGIQYELDAYPRISHTFYTYLNVGYSNDVGVFPGYRAGFSLYANLPKSFEADAGFRYLYFSSNTWIYTGSIGKYFKNYWFNLRSYLIPGSNKLSHSHNLAVRYYYGGIDDYFTLVVGTGISADDPINNIQLNNNYNLKSGKISIGYRQSFQKLNVIFFDATYILQEYRPKTTGQQITVGLGYKRRF